VEDVSLNRFLNSNGGGKDENVCDVFENFLSFVSRTIKWFNTMEISIFILEKVLHIHKQVEGNRSTFAIEQYLTIR
jgi:hypothetical protein